MKHIDTWMNERIYGDCSEEEKYAVAFFYLKGMNAISNIAVAPILKQHKLFCTYEDKEYRVIGCSRMGDIWLNPDFEKSLGYTLRVDADKCSKWSPEPTGIPKPPDRPEPRMVRDTLW